MKDYSRFYTPTVLAQFLISQCNDLNPQSVIDICAGSWNLLSEASNQWMNSRIIGVDTDNCSSNNVIQDGRVFAATSWINNELYDLVVANPPFSYEKLDANVYHSHSAHLNI